MQSYSVRWNGGMGVTSQAIKVARPTEYREYLLEQRHRLVTSFQGEFHQAIGNGVDRRSSAVYITENGDDDSFFWIDVESRAGARLAAIVVHASAPFRVIEHHPPKRVGDRLFWNFLKELLQVQE